MGYKLLAWGSDPTLNTIPADLAALLEGDGEYAISATTIGPNFAVRVQDFDTIDKLWIWGPETELHTIPSDMGDLSLGSPMVEGMAYTNQCYGDATIIYPTKDSPPFEPHFRAFGKNAGTWSIPASFTNGEWRAATFMYAYGSVVASVYAYGHPSGTQELYAWGSNALINAVPTVPFNPSSSGSLATGLAANGSVYFVDGYPNAARSYAWGADTTINSALTGAVDALRASDTMFLFKASRTAVGASAAIKAVPADVVANTITGPDYQRDVFTVDRSIVARVVVSGTPQVYAWGDSAAINAIAPSTLNDIFPYAQSTRGPNFFVSQLGVQGFAVYGESAIADHIPPESQSYWNFNFYYVSGSAVALAYDENYENPRLFVWGSNSAVNTIPSFTGTIATVYAVSDTNILIGIIEDGPPPSFWTDYKNTTEDITTHVLNKPPLRTLHPGTAYFPGQAASTTCPETPSGTLPTPSGNGLHGCYAVYKFKNVKTGKTAGAMVPAGASVPGQYNTQDWIVISLLTVCYS